MITDLPKTTTTIEYLGGPLDGRQEAITHTGDIPPDYVYVGKFWRYENTATGLNGVLYYVISKRSRPFRRSLRLIMSVTKKDPRLEFMANRQLPFKYAVRPKKGKRCTRARWAS